MSKILRFDAYKGIPYAFTFTVGDPADANRFLSAAVPWVAGDVLVDQNGGGVANIGTLPTRVGTTPLYRCSLTAAEMQGNNVSVLLVDQTGAEAWEDLHVLINTTIPGVIDSGVAVAGSASTIVLPVGARPTTPVADDFFNRYLITLVDVNTGATGVGQTRMITDYVGGSRTVHVSPDWATTPDSTSRYVIHTGGTGFLFNDLEGAEPSGAISDNATFRKVWQYIKRSILNRVDQDATTRTYFKDDSTTQLATMTITPGSTQSKGKIS